MMQSSAEHRVPTKEDNVQKCLYEAVRHAFADRRLNTTFPMRGVSLTASTRASIRASSLRGVYGGQRNRRASAAPATGDQSYRRGLLSSGDVTTVAIQRKAPVYGSVYMLQSLRLKRVSIQILLNLPTDKSK